MNRILNIFSNFFWFANCLPAYCRFQLDSRKIKKVQEKHLLSILNKNRNTEYGKRNSFWNTKSWNDFSKLPLTEYQDYTNSVKKIMEGKQNILTCNKVRIFQPTSGTSSEPKLIPHTDRAGNEFKSALNVWIFDLFKLRPKLFFGPQYWSISPSTEINLDKNSKIPVGFLDDAEYFGSWKRWIMDCILAVPSDVRYIPDIEANQYVTLLFLLRLKSLRLISVWHPSFLTILLKKARDNWSLLLNDIENGGINSDFDIPEKIRKALIKKLKPFSSRAGELKKLDPETEDLFLKVWPDIQVISCWKDGNVDQEITELEKAFPAVLIQGKGLIATEGVVSIPMGMTQEHVCAITSHILEFQDDEGEVHPAWDLVKGKEYCVIITTGAGLYRYRLNDRIKVTGFYKQNPLIKFLGRSGIVSDCVGEKLHLEHVEEILDNVLKEFRNAKFAILVPSNKSDNIRYNLLLETKDNGIKDLEIVAESLEAGLSSNYHYAHARNIGQLNKAVVTPLKYNARKSYRNFMLERGAIAGTIKFPALCTTPGIEEYMTSEIN